MEHFGTEVSLSGVNIFFRDSFRLPGLRIETFFIAYKYRTNYLNKFN